MSRIWYDTEFIEDGKTIDLISIGMVSEDDRVYYAVNGDPAVLSRAVNSKWLRENVVPHLPIVVIETGIHLRDMQYDWHWDNTHTDLGLVKPVWLIASQVRSFIQGTKDPQLRAWYAAYDHVRLMQLWGPMKDKPEGVPMWTFDLKQEAERLGNPRVPEQVADTEHHAMHDALHDREIDQFLARYEVEEYQA